MDRVASSYQFNAHAARAYGMPNAQRPLSVRPMANPPAAEQAAAARPNAAQTAPIGRIQPEAKAARPDSDPSRLVAAKVDPIDLSRDVATIQGKPVTSGYAMYRHPADRNAAATGVEIGRSLDVRG